jgi:hypothetical protein
MTAREININDVWKRRIEWHDGYDVIRVCGCIETDDELLNEWTVCPHPAFGQTVGTTSEGILDFCDLVQSGDPEETWETWETEVDDD